jgi:phosphatidylglycerol:prolipoprotein diacylglycerol transferase
LAPYVQILGVSLRSWALVVTLGVVGCWLLLLRRTRRLGYPSRLVFLWVLLAFPMGALSASLLARLLDGLRGAAPSLIAGYAASGLTVLGSLVGCLAFSGLYIRLVFREPPWRLLDAVAFTGPLAIAAGRMGCLLFGCCFGKPGPVEGWSRVLTIPLSAYDAESVARLHYAAVSPALRLWNLPLFLTANALLALLLTEAVYRKKTLRAIPGATLATALLVENLGRGILEWFRADEQSLVLGMNPWQMGALSIGAMAAAALTWLRVRGRRAIERSDLAPR